MAWFTRYQSDWKSVQNNNDLRLDIQSEVNGSIIEPKGTPNPVDIIMPSKDKFDPIKSTGLDISLISSTDRQLENLFAAGDKEYRVQLYQNDDLVWFGYLNSEQYSEPWTEVENYPVNFYANDGFNVLDKIEFLTDTGDRYFGIMSQWDVLQIIFNKWEMMDLVNEIKVSISTTSPSITIGAEETIFHNTLVKLDNYYDEDNKPMSCREVLDAILRPYGGNIIIQGTNIIITDVNTLAGLSFNYITYDNNYDYSASYSSGTSTDVNTLGYYKKGGDYQLKQGYKEHVVRYNKYKANTIDIGIHDTSLHYDSGSLVHDEDGDNDFYRLQASHSNFEFIESASIMGYKKESGDDLEYCMEIEFYASPYDNRTYNVRATSSFTDFYVIGNQTHYLNIKGNLKGRWSTDPYNLETTFGNPDETNRLNYAWYLSIGNKTFNGTTWVTSGTYDETTALEMIVGGVDSKPVDVWMPIGGGANEGNPSLNSNYPYTKGEEGLLISIPIGVEGYVTMSFSGHSSTYEWKKPLFREFNWISSTDWLYLYGIGIKDLELSVVKKGTLSPDEEDIEYIGTVNTGWTNKKQEHTIKHGCSYSNIGTPIDNGGLISKQTRAYIGQWYRAGEVGTIEELLLNSICSNNVTSTKKIGINLNNSTSLAELRLIDTTLLSGSMFILEGYEIDPTEESVNYDLVEVKVDGYEL